MFKNFKLFDTHTHTNIEPLASNANEIIKECKEKSLLICVVGTDLETSKIALEQAQTYDHVFCTIGIHPTDIYTVDVNTFIDELEALIKKDVKKKIVGIGECGLDYYHKPFNKEDQKSFFIKQMALAKKYDLALMMHIRDAHTDAIELLNKNKNRPDRCIVHCFTDDKKYISDYMKLGCYVSFPGVITFKNTPNNNIANLYEAIKMTEEDKILVETDAPFLTPVPYRGKVNYPYYVYETMKKIAEVKNIPIDDACLMLKNNALKVFKII
ncbi:TatD family hydrolase [Ureaplasma canigenitalium]|uniref:TatD family hydrolase n=1 Tax=Ureaplasma canigenitalium TaxID=42092 RepID=UPI0004E0BD79|nr:TatD family hydrolase [Ureaplasma canigenitalium]